jgi:hypothetical protein
MAGRPPSPPITIRVPGGGPPPAPTDASEGPDATNRRRLVAASAALGLVVTLGLTAARSEPPPDTGSAQGITAGVSLAGRQQRGAQTVRLQVDVDVEPLQVGRAADRRLTVVGMSAAGFAIALTPSQAVARGDDGAGVDLLADVSVSDCAGEPSAPRALEVSVRRGDRVPAELVADSGPDVVRALDRLVARVCNRPPG